jgi:hypothetical protein
MTAPTLFQELWSRDAWEKLPVIAWLHAHLGGLARPVAAEATAAAIEEALRRWPTSP